ncbi:MAG: hypothetical protein ACRDHO_09150 [Actinomycetota bacterium]
MVAVAWTAIALVAVGQLWMLYYLSGRIASLSARVDILSRRIDSLDARLSARLDGLAARMDTHIERHAS